MALEWLPCSCCLPPGDKLGAGATGAGTALPVSIMCHLGEGQFGIVPPEQQTTEKVTITQGSTNVSQSLVCFFKSCPCPCSCTRRRHQWDTTTERELSPGSCKSPNPPVLVSDVTSEPSSAPQASFTLCELAQEGSPSPPSFPGEFLPTSGSCPGSRIELINSELPQWKFTGCVGCARASRAPAAAASLSGTGSAAPGASPCPPRAACRLRRSPDHSLITQVTLGKSHFAPRLAQAAPNLGSRWRGKGPAGF